MDNMKVDQIIEIDPENEVRVWIRNIYHNI